MVSISHSGLLDVRMVVFNVGAWRNERISELQLQIVGRMPTCATNQILCRSGNKSHSLFSELGGMLVSESEWVFTHRPNASLTLANHVEGGGKLGINRLVAWQSVAMISQPKQGDSSCEICKELIPHGTSPTRCWGGDRDDGLVIWDIKMRLGTSVCKRKYVCIHQYRHIY